MAFGIERIYKKKTTVHYFDQKEIENGNRLDECYVLVIRCTTATIAIQVHFYFILVFFSLCASNWFVFVRTLQWPAD